MANEPTRDHLTLLNAANWRESEVEFGAPEMDGKRPYGNGDVLGDLVELLPHLTEDEAVAVHRELPGVLNWISRRGLGVAVNTPTVRYAIAAVVSDEVAEEAPGLAPSVAGRVFAILDRASAGLPLDAAAVSE